jgi:hypothetical protein
MAWLEPAFFGSIISSLGDHAFSCRGVIGYSSGKPKWIKWPHNTPPKTASLPSTCTCFTPPAQTNLARSPRSAIDARRPYSCAAHPRQPVSACLTIRLSTVLVDILFGLPLTLIRPRNQPSVVRQSLIAILDAARGLTRLPHEQSLALDTIAVSAQRF